MHDDARRSEIGAFLRARREALKPLDVGLQNRSRRRVKGLRREEVAELAEISTEYYTRIEQGRADINPSRAVYEGLARALQLGSDEQEHLFALANQLLPPTPQHQVLAVSDELLSLLEILEPNPSCIMDSHWDVLAWNRGFSTVFGDLSLLPNNDRNITWLMFTNPLLRELVVDWEGHAQRVLAQFRASFGHRPGDARFTELIDKLIAKSKEFSDWWPLRDVKGRKEGRKEINHPDVGRLVLHQTTAQVKGTAGFDLVLYTPLPEENTTAKLHSIVKRQGLAETLIVA